jgi:hypothetical protein
LRRREINDIVREEQRIREKKKEEDEALFFMIRSFNLVLPTELLMVILFVKSNENF